MKQLRIDFPDYPARQQERDIAKAEYRKQTEVYISKVDGVWNAIIPRKHNFIINGIKGEVLIDFIESVSDELKEMNIKPQFRCVENYGLDAHFRHCQQILRRFNNGRE